jgi:hypothetical protein
MEEKSLSNRAGRGRRPVISYAYLAEMGRTPTKEEVAVKALQAGRAAVRTTAVQVLKLFRSHSFNFRTMCNQ